MERKDESARTRMRGQERKDENARTRTQGRERKDKNEAGRRDGEAQGREMTVRGRRVEDVVFT